MTPEQLKTKTTLELLEIFKSKACCSYPSSQNIAKKIYRELDNRFVKQTLSKISTAWEHFVLGEGADELRDEVTKLIVFSKEIEESKYIHNLKLKDYEN